MRSQDRFSRRTLAASVLITAPALRSFPALSQSTPVATPAVETRVVTDVYGDIEVPSTPQRVIVLDGPQLDACLAVGLTPIGAVTGFDGAAFPAYLGELTHGIENVGTISEPNLEKIISLKPDLILGSNLRNEEIHDVLAQIAPTVFSEAVSDDWRGNFTLFTDALNKSTEATEVMAAYDARLEEFRAATEGEREDWVISIVRFLSDHVRLYNDTSFIGTILSAAGLNLPENQRGPDPSTGSIFTQISLEQIHLADGTHIFTCAYGDVKSTQAADYVNSTLWQSLKAVQDGHVYWVDDDFWMVAIGFIAANRVVDDLFTYLVNGDPGEAIPL